MTRLSPIGLDVGAKRIKAVQLSRRAGGARVVACAAFDRLEPDSPPSAREMDRVGAVLERTGFLGRECVVAADRAGLMTSELELPPEGSGAPREQIARLELARAHKREPAGFEMGLWDIPAPARSGTAGAHALATACPHERAEAVLDAAEAAGLDVSVIDHPSCALARVACRGAAAAPRAILDLGWSSAVLVLVRSGTVLFERSIEGGSLRRLWARIAEQPGISHGVIDVLLTDHAPADPGAARRGRSPADRAARCVHEFAEAVGRELRMSAEYLARRFPAAPGEAAPAEQIDLVGGGAHLPAVVAQIAERSGCVLRPFRPADVLGADDRVLGAASSPALCTAAGLALRDAEDHP